MTFKIHSGEAMKRLVEAVSTEGVILESMANLPGVSPSLMPKYYRFSGVSTGQPRSIGQKSRLVRSSKKASAASTKRIAMQDDVAAVHLRIDGVSAAFIFHSLNPNGKDSVNAVLSDEFMQRDDASQIRTHELNKATIIKKLFDLGSVEADVITADKTVIDKTAARQNARSGMKMDKGVKKGFDSLANNDDGIKYNRLRRMRAKKNTYDDLEKLRNVIQSKEVPIKISHNGIEYQVDRTDVRIGSTEIVYSSFGSGDSSTIVFPLKVRGVTITVGNAVMR